MAKNKYTIKYTETFVNQFNNILKYFIYKLQNKIAAENLYEEVIRMYGFANIEAKMPIENIFTQVYNRDIKKRYGQTPRHKKGAN